jgi:hypothetical protein
MAATFRALSKEAFNKLPQGHGFAEYYQKLEALLEEAAEPVIDDQRQLAAAFAAIKADRTQWDRRRKEMEEKLSREEERANALKESFRVKNEEEREESKRVEDELERQLMELERQLKLHRERKEAKEKKGLASQESQLRNVQATLAQLAAHIEDGRDTIGQELDYGEQAIKTVCTSYCKHSGLVLQGIARGIDNAR